MGCCARRVPVAARRILWRGKEKHPPCASFALVLIMLWCATLAQCRDTKNLARAPVGTSGPREAGMTDDQEELESRNALEQAFGHLGGLPQAGAAGMAGGTRMLFPGQERSREESHYLVSVAILRVNHSCSVTPPTRCHPPRLLNLAVIMSMSF